MNTIEDNMAVFTDKNIIVDGSKMLQMMCDLFDYILARAPTSDTHGAGVEIQLLALLVNNDGDSNNEHVIIKFLDYGQAFDYELVCHGFGPMHAIQHSPVLCLFVIKYIVECHKGIFSK
mgnify:CR=1 FL=1